MSDLKIGPIELVAPTGTAKGRKKSDLQFSEIVKGAIDQVNRSEKHANQSIVDLLQKLPWEKVNQIFSIS